MSDRMTPPAPAVVAAVAALLALAGTGSPLSAADDELTFARDPRPKTFVTDFTWYHPNERPNGTLHPHSLACTRAQPRRAFGDLTATDYLSSGGYYGEKYQRFRRRGIDGIAFLITDRIPDSFDGSNLTQVAGFAVDAGLEFFAYYDLFVTTAKESGLVLCLPGGVCSLPAGRQRIPSYNLQSRPQIYEQLREDFARIGEHLILPHLHTDGEAGYCLLRDADGELVRDEEDLPRPILAIYIARQFSTKPANLRRIGELMDEVTAGYRNLGIGKPAVVLDVLYWATPSAADPDATFNPDVVGAFGDYAVAVTWYGFFDPYQGARSNIFNDGPRPPIVVWAKKLHQRYHQARAELIEHGLPLAIWPGVQTQIDTRAPDVEGCNPHPYNVVFHLRSAEDWRTMFRKALANAWRPIPPSGPPLQAMVVVANAGEWFEIGALDYTHPDRWGECTFPYHWCTSLLEVVQEEDRYSRSRP